jgi:hypothetical protein
MEGSAGSSTHAVRHPGLDWYGSAWIGMVRHGMARQGMERTAWDRVPVLFTRARLGKARHGWVALG